MCCGWGGSSQWGLWKGGGAGGKAASSVLPGCWEFQLPPARLQVPFGPLGQPLPRNVEVAGSGGHLACAPEKDSTGEGTLLPGSLSSTCPTWQMHLAKPGPLPRLRCPKTKQTKPSSVLSLRGAHCVEWTQKSSGRGPAPRVDCSANSFAQV